MEAFDYLNNVYKELCEKSDIINKALSENGLKHKMGFFNNHYEKINDKFIVEYYPIPVISINGIGDIGIDINNVWFEAQISKEKAIAFDYTKLIGVIEFEIYGADDFLSELYDKEDTSGSIVYKIRNSCETNFCVLFSFGRNFNITKLLEAIHLFTV
ncbi:MAG: hypothetical protein FWB91_10460 [Defluviitaleaceae bacterium]|nr:hypothetical protein [Defluviitaleaceae bacterium]